MAILNRGNLSVSLEQVAEEDRAWGLDMSISGGAMAVSGSFIDAFHQCLPSAIT